MPWHGPSITHGTMHRALRPVLTLCTLTALAFGCHSNEPANEPANVDSARAGWRSATIDQNGVSTMVTGSVSCPEGGTLKLDADAQTSEDLVATTLEIEFDGCGADGVVIDGHFEIAAEVTDTKVSTLMTGDLWFSGDAQGTCEIDIGATVTDDASSTSVSSHGSVCGFGYDELFG
jgi:hypothetical protein